MGKRTREETINGAVDQPEPVKVKKAKKSKALPEEEVVGHATPTDGTETEVKEIKEERKARKAEKRRSRAEKAAIADATTADAEIIEQDEAKKLSKEDRKAAKKARKEAKASAAAAEPEKDGGQVDAKSDAKSNGHTNGSSGSCSISQSEIDAFYASKQITIEEPGNSKPTVQPIIKFDHLPKGISLPEQFASFTSPTPIQSAAWPYAFNGQDVVGVAETGSGKTMAFGLPCISHISKQQQKKGVKAVIVSPTRELAIQIEEQMVKLAQPAGLKVTCVYGGVPKDPQKEALKKANIVVATPGRLNDLINEGSANISNADYLVLDEADRMLDKGFEEDIKKIIGAAQPLASRQTLMFTATWPESIRKLASTFMKQPVKIIIGDNVTGELRANTRIEQIVEVMDGFKKEGRLEQLLREHTRGEKKNDRILVFCLYKKEATRIEQFIGRKGFKVGGIHGDLGQKQREASLESFKAGHVPILVATDVAARGLDIPAVKLVINVTFPLTAEDYVHRIGRTGRAGQTGKAITFFTDHDKALAGALVNVLKAAKQNVPEDLLKFGTAVKKKTHDAYGAFTKDIDPTKKATKITFD